MFIYIYVLYVAKYTHVCLSTYVGQSVVLGNAHPSTHGHMARSDNSCFSPALHVSDLNLTQPAYFPEVPKCCLCQPPHWRVPGARVPALAFGGLLFVWHLLNTVSNLKHFQHRPDPLEPHFGKKKYPKVFCRQWVSS